jgi:hypothetical protein
VFKKSAEGLAVSKYVALMREDIETLERREEDAMR